VKSGNLASRDDRTADGATTDDVVIALDPARSGNEPVVGTAEHVVFR
jgi:hypothetical protein